MFYRLTFIVWALVAALLIAGLAACASPSRAPAATPTLWPLLATDVLASAPSTATPSGGATTTPAPVFWMGATPAVTPTISPLLHGTNLRIAFLSNRTGELLYPNDERSRSQNQLYVMNADGSGLMQLTHLPGNDGGFGPAWSPDGARIAFAFATHDASGNQQTDIYLARADVSMQELDGKGLISLTHHLGANTRPAWSPDGARIAFESDRDGSRKIYVVNADGSGLTRLTSGPANDSAPHWSPDGSRIAFISDRDGNGEIYVALAPRAGASVNPDDSGLVNLTHHPASDGELAWSPDGKRVAFSSNRDGNWEIYLVNADGSGAANLTHNPAIDSYPAWSPNGARIAFQSNRDGNDEIYVVNADGSGLVNVSNSPAADTQPAWSPDGAWIAFTSNRDFFEEIYIVKPDGSGRVNLTRNPASDFNFAWQPLGHPSP